MANGWCRQADEYVQTKTCDRQLRYVRQAAMRDAKGETDTQTNRFSERWCCSTSRGDISLGGPGSTTCGGRVEQEEANSEESPDSPRHPFRDRRRDMWNGQDAARGSSDTKDGTHEEVTDEHGGCIAERWCSSTFRAEMQTNVFRHRRGHFMP